MRVLSVGPRSDQSGGMASVVAELEAFHHDRVGSPELIVIDSGGLGDGPLRRLLVFAHCLCRILFVQADLAHVHVASRGSTWRKMLVGLLCEARSLPYGIHLHGASYADFLASQSRHRKLLISRFFSRARYVVVLGENWSRLVSSQLGVEADKIHVIHNGVTDVRARVESGRDLERRTVLFLGRVEPLKGVPELLSAWDRLSGTAARLVMAGPEANASTVRAVKDAARLSAGSVEYLGLVTREDSLALLGGAWVFVLPSRAEGLPMALIEAMSAGVPCIGTRVGAVEELIDHGVNGYLVDPGDVTSLSRFIDLVVSDPVLRESLSRAARSTWERGFRASQMCARLESLWLSVG